MRVPELTVIQGSPGGKPQASYLGLEDGQFTEGARCPSGTPSNTSQGRGGGTEGLGGQAVRGQNDAVGTCHVAT